MESEICMKMLSNFNETKFCVSRSVYSMVKIIHLNDAFSQFFELKASPVQSQSLQQKDKKRRKGKCKKIKKTKSLKMSVTFLSKTQPKLSIGWRKKWKGSGNEKKSQVWLWGRGNSVKLIISLLTVSKSQGINKKPNHLTPTYTGIRITLNS